MSKKNRIPWSVLLLGGITLGICGVLIFSHTAPLAQADAPLNAALIKQWSGIQGTFDEEYKAYQFSFARPGMQTEIDGFAIPSAFGLMGYFTLSGTDQHAVLLGNLPLGQSEVNSILPKLLAEKITVTSLHNRFLNDSARVMSMHIETTGSAHELATVMGNISRELLRASDKPSGHLNKSAPLFKNSLNAALMSSLLWKGDFADGIFRVSVGRSTTIDKNLLGKASAIGSWASFMGAPEQAVVNGEISTLEFELPDVLKDLQKGGIQIVSIHTHLVQEKPRLVFVHFWGRGEIHALASAVKEAIWEKEHFQSQ